MLTANYELHTDSNFLARRKPLQSFADFFQECNCYTVTSQVLSTGEQSDQISLLQLARQLINKPLAKTFYIGSYFRIFIIYDRSYQIGIQSLDPSDLRILKIRLSSVSTRFATLRIFWLNLIVELLHSNHSSFRFRRSLIDCVAFKRNRL